MGISEIEIYKWRDSGRTVNLADDLEQIWDDSSVLQSFLSTRAYVDYIISQFQHEDFERDSCYQLMSQDGPYSYILNAVAKEIEGVEEPDYEPSFDSLVQYMTEIDGKIIDDDWVSTGNLKNVSEDELKEFFFRYLDAILKNLANSDYFDDPSDEYYSDFRGVMKPKVFETLIALRKNV